MIGIIVALIVAIGGLSFLRSIGRDKFEWQYKLTTDSKWIIMENDGGSNLNVYYLINLTDHQIQKCEDKYFGPMHKYDYRDKVIYQKELDERTAVKLQEILDNAWNTGEDTEGTYDYYSIETPDGTTRYIFNKGQISQIKLYTDRIDRQTTEETPAE